MPITREQKRVLEELDIEGVRKLNLPIPLIPADDKVILITLHKARVDCTGILRELRLESQEWLRARGYSRIGGLPLSPEGVLDD